MLTGFWLSFFVVTLLWGVLCLALRDRARPGRDAGPLRVLHWVASTWGLVAWCALPLVAGAPWWLPAVILAAGWSAGFGVRCLVRRKDVRFFQLREMLSWFLMAASFHLVGVVSRVGLWNIGGAIFLAAALWNAFATLHIKPALQEFYSDLDDRAIWSGPLLTEEWPVLAMLLPAFLLTPWPFGELDGARLVAFSRHLTSMLALLLAVFAIGSVMIGLYTGNELKRMAIARLLHGLTALVLLLLGVSLLAALQPPMRLHLDATFWATPWPGIPGRGTELLTVCLWLSAGSLMIGLLGTLLVLTSIPGRPAEHDLFLSFGTPDRRAAEDLARRIRVRGLRLFFSDESILAGDEFRTQIRKAVRNSQEMVTLATPRSIDRDWVRNEWALAMAMEKRIVPLLQELEPGQLPDILRDRQSIPWGDSERYLEELARRFRRTGAVALIRQRRPAGKETAGWPG
jgi:hypothetical protein